MKKKIKTLCIQILHKNRRQAGFTLIEMVIVIAIIIMLLVIIAPNLMHQKNNAQKKADQAFVATLQTQVEVYNDDHPKDKLKDSLAPLSEGNKYLSDHQKKELGKYKLENGEVVLKDQ